MDKKMKFLEENDFEDVFSGKNDPDFTSLRNYHHVKVTSQEKLGSAAEKVRNN
jgi:hypothetical protein